MESYNTEKCDGTCEWHKVVHSEVKRNASELAILKKKTEADILKLRSDITKEIPECKREVVDAYSARFAAIWTVVILLMGVVIGMPIYAANSLNEYKVYDGEVNSRTTEAVATLKDIAINHTMTKDEILKLLTEIKTEISSITTKIQIYHKES